MIVIVGILILVWFLVSYLGAQQAVRWWYHRQSVQLCQEAEMIRDGLLQEVFTLRRHVELSLTSEAEGSNPASQQWLSVIERFHHSLKQLSDQLSPPFIDESLPLALQSLMESWRSRHAAIPVSLVLPSDWPLESHDRSRAVLIALNEVLRIHVSDTLTGAKISVSLSCQGRLSQLRVQINYPADAMSDWCACSQESDYLRRAFQILAGGSCFYRRQDQTITWYFRWPCSEKPVLEAPRGMQ